jgi:hypothetical protein
VIEHFLRIAREALAGAALGAVLLGFGGRIVMRTLAITLPRDPAFSLGGTLEVVAYGAIVGAVSGAAYSLFRPAFSGRWWAQGVILAALSYAGTIATLPAHIADTARPFADRMALVLTLFGLCFLAFGLATARISFRASSPASEAVPASPRE